MTDLEITRLCEEPMGYKIVYPDQKDLPLCVESERGAGVYFPLHDDAQAMALVKKLGLDVHCRADMNGWYVGRGRLHEGLTTHADLNRAICNAVAAIQLEAA